MDVKKVLNTAQNVQNLECVSYIMDFLLSLVKLKVPLLISLYPSFVKLAMTQINASVRNLF